MGHRASHPVLWGLNPRQRAKQIIRNSPRGDARRDIRPLGRPAPRPINAFAVALCDNIARGARRFGEKRLELEEGKMDFEKVREMDGKKR